MKRVFLITGFLGAGKTTLLKNLLAKNNTKTGLIINEFGKTGFDGSLLKDYDIEMIELNNGSIFCSCLEPQFIESLINMLNKPVETIFVESSGLSDPGRMKKALSEANAQSGIETELGGIITVVDISRLSQLIDVFPVIRRQIEVANSIIANKSDLAIEETLEETLTILEKLNPTARLAVTSYCNLIPEQILAGATQPFIDTYENLDLPKKGQKKILIRFSEAVDFEKLKSFIEEIAPVSLRIKGIANSSKGRHRIDCVESDTRFYPIDDSFKNSEIVMIFEKDSQVLKIIKENWREKFATKLLIS